MRHTTSQTAALQALKQFRAELEEVLENVRKTEDALIRFGGTMDRAPSVGNGDESIFSDLGPQQVVERFLRDRPGKFLSPGLIAKKILQQGYHPNSLKLWPTQVRNCLKRAEQKGIAETKEVEGRKRYGLKQEAEEVLSGDNQESTSA